MIRAALRTSTLLASVLVAACGLVPADLAVDTSGARDVTGAAVALVSQHRRAHGLPPVRADADLAAAAKHQASAVARAGTLSHDVGSSFTSRMAAYGAGRVAAAENLSMGPTTAEAAIARWKASPGHNANLLMPEARRVGMAYDGKYWAMVLAQ